MVTHQESTDPGTPRIAFGDPDGARGPAWGADFIPFERLACSNGTSARRASIVLGDKGTGKTLWLRQFYFELKNREPSALPLSPPVLWGAPSTEEIVSFGVKFPPSMRSEAWTLAWDRAILQSFASHYAHDARLRKYSAPTLASAPKDLAALIPSRPRSPYAQLGEVIDQGLSASRIFEHLGDPIWEEFSRLLGEAARSAPQTFYILDALDDDFSHAPSHWLACQQGLFIAALRRRRDPIFSHKARLVVALRDLVLSSLASDHHSHRWFGDPDIHILEWTNADLESLATLKLRRAMGEGTARPGGGTTAAALSAWLGIATSEGPQAWATLSRYLNAAPRDLIMILNRVADHRSRGAVGPTELLEAVRAPARLAGLGKLSLAAAEIEESESAQVLNRRGSPSWSDYSRNQTLESLTNLLALTIGDMSLDIDTLRSRSQRLFGLNLADLLWRHRLLGLMDDVPDADGFYSVRFRSARDWDSKDLPRWSSGYALHPCVWPAVAEEAPDLPVKPRYR